MKHSWFEIIAGFIAIISAVGFIAYATKNSNNINSGKQIFTAHFVNSRGIIRGSDVRINGVSIGKVKDVQIDKDIFEAIVTLSVADHLQIPFDSILSAQSPLLLGQPSLALIPGKQKNFLQSGDRIVNTRSEPSFEEILERAVFIIGEQAK